MGRLDKAGANVTRGRKTKLVLDEPGWWVQEPKFVYDVSLENIADESSPDCHNVHFIPDVGWRIKPLQLDISLIHETADGDTALFDLTVPQPGATTGIFQRNIYTAPKDNDGTPLSVRARTGDKFYERRVAANDSLAVANTADQTAYPSPNPEDDIVTLDRVGTGTRPCDPADHYCFRMIAALGHGAGSLKNIATLYFVSIPGSAQTDGADGTGQYALKLSGDGTAQLKEKLSDGTWAQRWNTHWSTPHGVMGASHTIFIASDAYEDSSGVWHGSVIQFAFYQFGNSLQQGLNTVIDSLRNGLKWQRFNVPKTKGDLQPVEAPVRIDIRRDFQAQFQVSGQRYWPTGTLKTKNFSLPFYPTTRENFSAQALGMAPEDSSVNIVLYDAETDTPLTPEGIGVNNLNCFEKFFQPVDKKRTYYAIITFHANPTQDGCPTLKRFRAVRQPILKQNVTVAKTPKIVSEITWTDQDSDPSHETATALVHDLGGELSILDKRAGMTARVVVNYDPTDATKFTNLFYGRMIRATSVIKGPKRPDGHYPVDKWKTRHCKMVGEAIRLNKQQLPKTRNFSIDPNTGQDGTPQLPYKVTDAVRIMLTDVYPAHMVQVPDKSTRLQASDKDKGYLVEAFSPVGATTIQMLRDWLGGFLTFDANATGDPTNFPNSEDGCWRAIIPPQPGKFNYLAEFVGGPIQRGTENPLHAYKPMDLAAYPDGPDTGQSYPGLADGQKIKRIPILKLSAFGNVVKPECNMVICTGMGVAGALLEKSEKNPSTEQLPMMMQIAQNFVSAWFRDDQPIVPDPNHPDYIDGDIWPLYVCEPGYNSQKVVDFACRRIFDIAAHAEIHHIFEGPLALVQDVTDIYSRHPRKLRYGDPVLYQGKPYLVASCNGDIAHRKGGSRSQMAVYDIFTTPFLQGLKDPANNLIEAANFGFAAGMTLAA